MAIGSIYLADLNNDSDWFYIQLFFIAKATYLVSAAALWSLRGDRSVWQRFWGKAIKDDKPYSKFNLVFLVILSVLITAVYYYMVGYNLFYNMVLFFDVDDFSSMRLAMYSGDRYFAAGYVNQFKNVLLPVGISIIAGWYWFGGHRKRFLMTVVVGSIILVFALLGTGQRAFLVYSTGALLFGISALKGLRFRTVALLVSVIFPLFIFTTAFYKVDSLIDAPSVLMGSVEKSLERLFVTEQEGALGAFRYLYDQEIVYFDEWKDQVLGLLPNHSGSMLQHELSFLVHETTRGTEGYATIAGFYHNGGVITVIICFFLMAVCHSMIYYRFLRGERTILRAFTYGALFFYLSIFASGGPSTLINNGAVTLVFLLLIAKINLTGRAFTRAVSGSFTPGAVTTQPRLHDFGTKEISTSSTVVSTLR